MASTEPTKKTEQSSPTKGDVTTIRYASPKSPTKRIEPKGSPSAFITPDPGYYPPPLKPSNKCTSCDSAFTYWNRRRACRNCGLTFCATHASRKINLDKFNLKSATVCDDCFDTVTKQKQWTPDPDTLVPAWKDGKKNVTTSPDGETEILKSASGMASVDPMTVMDCFRACCAANPDWPALRVERKGAWVQWTFKEYEQEVMTVAKALIKLGVEQFQSINVIGFNSPEWFFSYIGAIAVGAKVAGIYTTNGPDACKYISEHSDAQVVVVENEKQLEKYVKIRDELKLKAIVVYDGEVPEGVNVAGKTPVYSWSAFLKIGKDAGEQEAKEVEARIARQKPGHCCSLIYTSGTTGPPKAVMISHDNLTWVARSFLSISPTFGDRDCPEGEHCISYLPLSHIAAQLLDIHMQIIVGAVKGGKCTIHFAKPDALKGSLGPTMQQVRPTIFFGVPRVWEKIEEGIMKKGASTTGLKKAISTWAKDIGATRYQNISVGGSGGDPLMYSVANHIVFSKVKQVLGLDRSKFMLTAAAPISKSTLEYFGSLDIQVLEIYGMSENTGPQNVSLSTSFLAGSCGRPLPGCEVKIDHVAGRDIKGEGEILCRGRHVMMGYMKDPAKTAETIDDEGWLHTGDVGRVDENGLLYITGRIKELIITAGGENIAPVPVEDRLKQALPAISNCVMIGDKKKYNTVLITLRQEQKGDTFTNALTGASLTVDPECTTVSAAKQSAKWKAYIEAGMKAANADAVSNASMVQKFSILDSDFSIEGGELTATMKLKRPVVMKKYEQVIESMYAESSE
eukprot:g81620.t1